MSFETHKPASYPGTTVPAIDAEAINYSGGDQTLVRACRALYIGSAGNLQVVMRGGSTVTFSNMVAGTIYPFSVTKILQASGTAAGVVLY